MAAHKDIRAFTLIELIVTLSVVAILTVIATPSFVNMIRNNRITVQANDLLSTLQLARAEAIKQGVQVTVLKSGATDSVWDAGWIVFTDWDGDGVYDDDGTLPACDTEEDCLVSSHDALLNTTIRTGTTYDKWMAYLPDGSPTASGSSLGNDTFRVCGTDSDVTLSRVVIVSTTGRPKVEEGANTCP